MGIINYYHYILLDRLEEFDAGEIGVCGGVLCCDDSLCETLLACVITRELIIWLCCNCDCVDWLFCDCVGVCCCGVCECSGVGDDELLMLCVLLVFDGVIEWGENWLALGDSSVIGNVGVFGVCCGVWLIVIFCVFDIDCCFIV